MKNLQAIIIGTVALVLYLYVTIGMNFRQSRSVEDFFVFLYFWVVCTGGAILIPFFLLAWLIGLLVMAVYALVGQGRLALAELTEKRDPIDLLVRYIRKAKREGVPESFIELLMASNGWSHAEVVEAQRRIAKSAAE